MKALRLTVRLGEADVALLRSRQGESRGLGAALLSLIDELIQDVRTARVRFALPRLHAEARRRRAAGQRPEATRRWLLRRCRAIARRPFKREEYGSPRVIEQPAGLGSNCSRVTVVLEGPRAAFVRTLPGPPEKAVRGLIEWAHGRAAFARLFDTESALRWEARVMRYAGYGEDTIATRQSWRWACLQGPRRPATRSAADRPKRLHGSAHADLQRARRTRSRAAHKRSTNVADQSTHVAAP